MRQQIEKIIIDALVDLNEELENAELKNPNKDTRIYGGRGVLDSITLVSLIVDLEQKISEIFGKNIVLANDKAMSQRVSPFRTVETLTHYIEKLLNEE